MQTLARVYRETFGLTKLEIFSKYYKEWGPFPGRYYVIHTMYCNPGTLWGNEYHRDIGIVAFYMGL